MACADPIGAKEAEAADMTRTLQVASLLHEHKYEYVAAVQGGMCEMLREMRARGIDPGLADAGGGWMYLAAEAYSLLDFEDSQSFARFLTAFVNQFAVHRGSKSDSVDSSVGRRESVEDARPRRRSLEAVLEKAKSDLGSAIDVPKAALARRASGGGPTWAKWGFASGRQHDRGEEGLELEQEDE